MTANAAHAACPERRIGLRATKWWYLRIVKKHSRGPVVGSRPSAELLNLTFLPAFIDCSGHSEVIYSLGLEQEIHPDIRGNLYGEF
jgi:hypothetical protein